MESSPNEILTETQSGCLRFVIFGLLLPGALFAIGSAMGIPDALMVGVGVVGFFAWLARVVVSGTNRMRQLRLRSESPESVAARTAAQPADEPEPVFSVFAVAAQISTGPKPQHLESAEIHGFDFGCLLMCVPLWLPITFGPTVWSIFHMNRLPNVGFVAVVCTAFLCIGLWLVRTTVRAGFVWSADREVGPLQVGLSDSPVRPGGCYRLRVEGPRGVPLGGIRVELIGSESVVCEDGEGGSSTSRSEVVRLTLGGGPKSILPIGIDIDFPVGIMPSFRTESIAISWEIHVSGRLSARFSRQARFHRRYPFEIEPNE